MIRVLDRAAKWLIECGYLEEFWYSRNGRKFEVFFRKRTVKTKSRPDKAMQRTEQIVPSLESLRSGEEDELKAWLTSQDEAILFERETEALNSRFGSELERGIVQEQRSNGVPISGSRRIRQEYIRRFIEGFTLSLAV
jgi:hypothetical protein